MHHRVHMTWTDSYGNIGLSWNMLKQLFGARLHAVHVGDGMFAVHVVHYIEVAHFIIRGTTADKTKKWVEYITNFTIHNKWRSKALTPA